MNVFSMIGKKQIAVKLLTLILCIAAMSSQSLTFHVTYDSSVTSQANAAQIETAFGVATQTMQTLYTNSSTVNITVYWGNTGPFTNGIDLGASETFGYFYSYAAITNALRATRTTIADSNSVASLPSADPTGGQWLIPLAEAKAMNVSSVVGISANDTTHNDGDVGFASDVSYTFDSTNRAVAGEYDFIAVAEHELTEVMGRSTFDLDESGVYLPYDLFRFTTSGTRSFLANDDNVYFSVNNGVTALKYFNPNNGGDIQDWESSSTADSYDAFISWGESGKLSSADLTTLDVIGYKLNFKVPSLTSSKLANGNYKISFTNVTGMNFVVLASTNISLAVSNWTNLGSPTEGPAGQYQFTDTASGNQRFYLVKLP